MHEVDKKMEGVNLEEKCLVLKSSDKEGAAEEKEKEVEEKRDSKEKDEEKSAAVKLVGQVQSDGRMRFQEIQREFSSFFSFLPGRWPERRAPGKLWRNSSSRFFASAVLFLVWSRSGCLNLPNL